MVYEIKPSKFATKKTKDRIQQHGNLWVHRSAIQHRVLLESCKDQYLKWFESSEIIAVKKGE